MMQANGRLVARRPIAWGMMHWGPLPGTRDMWISWGGPGDGLEFYAHDPAKPGSAGQRIRHPSANGTYDTLGKAEAAVSAFVRIGLAAG